MQDNTKNAWERLEELFHDALSQSPSERSLFLTSACAGDTQLRRRVEKLILAAETSQNIIEDVVSGEAATYMNAPEAWNPGERIGVYEIVRQLGHGGMGMVYLAIRADETYQKEVAVKVMRADMVTRHAVQRFRAERQILASLEHLNIARLLDGGATKGGSPYVVMEYVKGSRVDEYCRERSLDLQQRLRLFLSIGSAVSYAHRSLVIHRDIKPQNVLVTEDGVPKLIDFGIAKLLMPEVAGGDPSKSATMTMAAELVLTPEYASPEQVRGEQITTASDVYQLGVLLYRLLTGKLPLRVRGTSIIEIEREICEAEPVRPSAAARHTSEWETVWCGSGKGGIRDLDGILLKALEKDPARRYSSVDNFSADIESFLAGFPVTARGGSRRYRAGKFLLRHRWASLGIALTLLVIASFSVAMGILAAQARREARAAGEVTDFLVNVFSANDPAQGRGDKVTARELLDKGAAGLDGRLSDEPEVKAHLYSVVGELYQSLYANPQSEANLRKALALERKLHPALNKQTVDSMRKLADTLINESKYSEASELLRQVLPYEEQHKREHPDELAFTYEALSVIDFYTGYYSEDEQLLVRALAILVPRHGNSDQDVLRLQGDLSCAYDSEGKFRQATEMQRLVLDTRLRTLGKNAPDVGYAWYNLSQDLTHLGDYEKALQAGEQAVAVETAAFGESNFLTISNLPGLAENQMRRNYVVKAVTTARRAYDLYRRSGDLDSNVGSRAEIALGQALLADGKISEAIAMLDASLKTRVRILGGKETGTADSEAALGEAYLATGDTGKAETLERASLALEQSVLGPNHEGTNVARLLLAQVLIRERRWDEATTLAMNARAIERATFPEGHPMLGQAEVVLGQTELHAERAAEALPHFQDAVVQLERGYGHQSPQAAGARIWMACAEVALGRQSDAERTVAGQAEILAASPDPRLNLERKLAIRVRKLCVTALRPGRMWAKGCELVPRQTSQTAGLRVGVASSTTLQRHLPAISTVEIQRLSGFLNRGAQLLAQPRPGELEIPVRGRDRCSYDIRSLFAAHSPEV